MRGAVLVFASLVLSSTHALADAVHEREGPGWALVHLEAGPDDLVKLTISFQRQGGALAGIELRQNGSLGLFTSGSPGAAYEVASHATGELFSIHVGSTPFEMSLTLQPNGVEGFVGDLLVWTAGDVGSWTYRTEAPPQVTFSVLGHGDRTFYWDGKEVSRGGHAHASLAGAGASVQDAEYRFVTSGPFVGWVGLENAETRVAPLPPTRISNDQVILTFPDGSQHTCPCGSPSPGTWTPGAYSVTWKGVHVFGPGQAPIVVAGVDAPPYAT